MRPRPALVLDGLPLDRTQQPALRRVEIDRLRDLEGEHREARAFGDGGAGHLRNVCVLGAHHKKNRAILSASSRTTLSPLWMFVHGHRADATRHPAAGAAAPLFSVTVSSCGTVLSLIADTVPSAGGAPMQNDVRLSLVIPVYNGADSVPGTLAQLSDWLPRQPACTELVLVNDGSNLRTATLLREFAGSTR